MVNNRHHWLQPYNWLKRSSHNKIIWECFKAFPNLCITIAFGTKKIFRWLVTSYCRLRTINLILEALAAWFWVRSSEFYLLRRRRRWLANNRRQNSEVLKPLEDHSKTFNLDSDSTFQTQLIFPAKTGNYSILRLFVTKRRQLTVKSLLQNVQIFQKA